MVKVDKSNRQSRRNGDEFLHPFATYQIWEYCSRPTKECSGLLKTEGSIFKLAREELHMVGCRGVPFLTAKHELMYAIGTV